VKTINDLQLLAGIPIAIRGVGTLTPLKVSQVAEMGEDRYNHYLSILCFNVQELDDEVVSVLSDEVTSFDIIISQCFHDEQFCGLVVEGLSTFFADKVEFVRDYGVFYLGDVREGRIITRDNYEEIKHVLRTQNFVQDKIKEEYNPANERARQLIEQIKQNQKNAPKTNEKTLYSIISGIAWKSHIGIKSVWDLTIYQLFDAYYRLELVDAWDKTLTGIYSGSIDGKKINLKDLSWSKPIKFK